MKVKVVTICVLLLSIATSISAQGIKFFKGNLEETLIEAKRLNKLVFIDFYADWCAPCKQLSETVFPKEEVGTYFNAKFVSVKIDTDATANKKLVKQYKISSMPTLMFLDANGKMLSVLVGSAPAEDLIRAAKVVTGEELSFVALYEKLKTTPDDLDLIQKVLLDAPGYVAAIENKMEKEKWILRVEKLFKDYVEKKMGDTFINKEDYKLVNTFHKPEPENDKLVEFMNSNMDNYLKNVGKAVGYYVLEYNNKIISELAKAGKEEYKKHLDRINGDMKSAYSVMDVNNITPYEMYKYLFDGEYLIFYKKNADEYISLTDKYLDAMGEKATSTIYAGAAQKMYYAMGKKLEPKHHTKAIEWMVKSMQCPNQSLMERINVIIMLGDSFRDLGKYNEARKYYNQAYMESVQIKQEMNKKYVQMSINKKITALQLVEK